MLSIIRNVFILCLLFSFSNKVSAQGVKKFKCLIQMTNYMGEGAYIIISVVDKDGKYVKTLYVLGADKKWYPDVKEWHKFYKMKPTNINAITGASVSGGDRAVKIIEIDENFIDKNYSLRFETAVENNLYNVKDLEMPITTSNLSSKNEGKGYIRYVRFTPN